MEMNIGERIARRRREKGWTQEYLAGELGVSAAAVSKWENNASLPDLMLLCPLARALDTNVDMLIGFEQQISDQEAAEKVNAILIQARGGGAEDSEKQIEDLLHRYPNSVALKYYAAAVYDVLRVLNPQADDVSVQRWQMRKKYLLQAVRAAEHTAYTSDAILQLAGIALQEEPDQAEALLHELPDHSVDATFTWAQLHLQRNEPEEAMKVLQKRLFFLTRQVHACLVMMVNERIILDGERALRLCGVIRQVDELFGCGGLYDAFEMQAHLRMGHMEEAVRSLARYAKAVTGSLTSPDPDIFAPGVTVMQGQDAMGSEMRRVLLLALREEETCWELLKLPEAQEALRKIEESLQEETA